MFMVICLAQIPMFSLSISGICFILPVPGSSLWHLKLGTPFIWANTCMRVCMSFCHLRIGCSYLCRLVHTHTYLCVNLAPKD